GSAGGGGAGGLGGGGGGGDERVDHHLGELAVDGGIGPAAELGRHLAPHDDAAAPLHDEEGNTQDGAVLAVHERPRGGLVHAVERREHPILPAHVVCARRQVAVRGAAGHVVVPSGIVEQVGQVRVPAGELPDLGCPARAGEPTGEVLAHRRRVDLFTRTDGDHVGGGKARARVLHVALPVGRNKSRRRASTARGPRQPTGISS